MRHNNYLSLFNFQRLVLTMSLLLFIPCLSNAQNKISITGIVVDAKGESIIGASVIQKGTSNGTITDIDGHFSLQVPENSTLLCCYLGYQKKEVKVKNQTFIKVVLNEDTFAIKEVVVVGYGSMDKKELTSAISHVSSKDFLQNSSVDPSMLIQGKIPGVSITNSGASDPNNLASIQVRGISSRAAGLGPLIVIDGVAGGSLENVNSNDIASIDVLKDGAASAIYGTRGSNGVILVTTKKGNKDGQLHTTYQGLISASFATNELDMLDANEFRKLRAGNEHGLDLGGNDDWTDAVSRVGIMQQHTLSFSGGNNKSNYRASVDYRGAKGVDLRSSRKEYGARLFVSHETKNGLLKFTASIAPRSIKREDSAWDAFKWALEMNPTTPIYDSKRPSGYSSTLGQSAVYNPVELLKTEESGGEIKLLDWDATAKLNLLPLLAKNKTCKSLLNTQIMIANHTSDTFSYWFRPSTSNLAISAGYTGEANRKYNKTTQNSLEWLTNYETELGQHHVKAMLGYSYQYFQYSGMSSENKDFPSDALKYNNLAEGEWAKDEGHVGVGTYKNDSKLIAFFGRLSYDYKNRYLFTTSLRYEGSSKFGANNKWGYFPAVSAGWRISEENFMKDISWINELKLRADYGVTGNQDFESYLSLATMRGFGSYYYGGEFFTVWGASKNPNADLHWEKGHNYNVGVDFSLFKNRLSGSINYYYRKQQDLLGNYNVPVPPNLYSSTFVNVGTMKNSGIEIDLKLDIVRKKDFSYSLTLVGATNNNEFIDFSNGDFIGQDYYNVCKTEVPIPFNYLQRIQKGKRLGTFYMWKYAGLDKDGKWLVYNEKNQKISVDNAKEEDKREVGNGLPHFTGSMGHSFTYKNWRLSLFFRGAFGYDIYNVHDLYYGLKMHQGNVMKKAYAENAAINDRATVTDYFLEKGDYLKLDMITLGYTWNLDTKFINQVDFYVTGKNLYTFTGFSGVDPATYQTNGLTPGATGSRTYYPSCRQVMAGIKLSF